MAAMAMEAIAEFAKSGTKPTVDSELGFLDTGATLITDKPAEGVESIDTTEGMELCWG
jgi:fructose transport system substrate-binding protein